MCWGDSNSGVTSPPSDSAFMEISLEATRACGIRADHTVECWGSPWYLAYYGDAANPPSSTFLTANTAVCTTCPQAFYCNGDAALASPCTVGGFWCPVGSTSPTSTACLAGTYCPEGGSSTGVPLVCPLGYYCTEATAVPALCDFAGYLCPAGSSSPTGTQCNAGRFGTSAGASIYDSGDCEGPCTGAAGRYCPKGSPDTDGMLCSDGSYCTGGSAVSDGGAGFCLCATAVINFVLAMHL